jgi:hypothetical protein
MRHQIQLKAIRLKAEVSNREEGNELFTSTGRIRRTVLQSQARMVDGPKMLHPAACHNRVASKSQKQNSWAAHRRTVDGSGIRSGSLTLGIDCSQLLASCPDVQACCRQLRL